MKPIHFKLTLIVAFFAFFTACGVLNEKNKGKGFNLFTIEQDKALGAQVAHEIDSNTTKYPLLDSEKKNKV